MEDTVNMSAEDYLSEQSTAFVDELLTEFGQRLKSKIDRITSTPFLDFDLGEDDSVVPNIILIQEVGKGCAHHYDLKEVADEFLNHFIDDGWNPQILLRYGQVLSEIADRFKSKGLELQETWTQDDD